MQVSYSFHISSKSHALTTADKIAHVSRHNLRNYKSADYRKEDIEVIRGSDKSILEDVRAIYHREFDEAIKEYNSRQKRSDRLITDYLNELSKKQSDVACEIIIQIGDMNYWADKTTVEKRHMSQVFKSQLNELERLCPDFKIANAVIHYDEKSPHMHVVGVPVAQGYSKGLFKRVAKTRVFTRESLSTLQDSMREHAKNLLEQLSIKIDFKPKEKGRNKDIPKYVLNAYYQVIHDTKQKQDHIWELDANLREKNKSLRRLDKDINARYTDLQKLDNFEELRAIYQKAYGEYFELEFEALERSRSRNKNITHD